MRKGMKVLAILALVAGALAANEAVFANCVSEGPFEIRQCSKGAWFDSIPSGSGAVSAAWWGIGFGNRTLAGTATAYSKDGSGFLPTPLPGLFIGVDNGLLTLLEPNVLVSAPGSATGAPPGSLCFSYAANWGYPGMDSCVDINRNEYDGGSGSTGNLTADLSDGFVNRYWDTAPCDPGLYDCSLPQYTVYNHLLDPPMGVLLTEGSGRYFAAAFFASIPKQSPRNQNLDAGQYSIGDISNGDAGPAGSNIVPWQPIPSPYIAATLSDPNDPASTRNLDFDWSATLPRFLHDGSTRPCIQLDGATPCASMPDRDGGGPLVPGVGVLDQGPLMHFEVEMVAMDLSGTCGAGWASVAGSKRDYPVSTVSVTGIPAQTCVRLKTSFGATPTATFRTGATSTNRNLNRRDAQRGFFGDVGYFVASAPTKVGGPLVSEHANLRAITKDRNDLRVVFDTDTEINVTSFDVVGIDNKGGRKLLGTVACKQCTTGLGASYDELISGAKLQGSRKVQIVMQPSGAQSNTLDLK